MKECPKCPQCGEQTVLERVYGVGRLCRCRECGYRVRHPEGPLDTRGEAIRRVFSRGRGSNATKERR